MNYSSLDKRIHAIVFNWVLFELIEKKPCPGANHINMTVDNPNTTYGLCQWWMHVSWYELLKPQAAFAPGAHTYIP